MIYLKKITTKNKKVFFLYTTVIAILVLAVITTRYILEWPEIYYLVVRLYIAIEYSLLAYFFSLYIKNRYVKNTLLFSQVPFFLFCIYDFIIEKVPELPFVPASVENMILLCFIIYYFFEVMQETVIEPIYQKAIFWISVAFIINSSGNFFLFLYSENSYKDDVFKRQYTIIYTTVTVLKNLLLCISILIKESRQDNISPHDSIDIDLDTFHPIKNKI